MKKTELLTVISMFFCLMSIPVMAQNIPQKNERPAQLNKIHGYTDTPTLPGEKWHVHDPNRPQPPVVTPNYNGRRVPPPEEATVLFDGSNLNRWKNSDWIVRDGYMAVNNGYQTSKETFGDVYLHLEYRMPKSVSGWGQKRGNSGVFLMGRYEIQVLDNWANRVYPDGQAGAIYGQKPPRVNACRKPGQWQSYDIFFRAPETDEDGEVIEPARMTVLHNGIPIHNNVELLGKTAHKSVAQYQNPPSRGPLKLQEHGNEVHYRNIWVVPMD